MSFHYQFIFLSDSIVPDYGIRSQETEYWIYQNPVKMGNSNPGQNTFSGSALHSLACVFSHSSRYCSFPPPDIRTFQKNSPCDFSLITPHSLFHLNCHTSFHNADSSSSYYITISTSCIITGFPASWHNCTKLLLSP